MPPPHVLLFDPYAGGHHGQYVRELVRYWGENALSGRLSLVVPAHFLDTHTDLQPLLARYAAAGVALVPIEEPVRVPTEGLGDLVRSSRQHRRILRTHVERLRPDHAVLMYFDHLQLALATDLRFDFPVQLSGVYFRPSFHYGRLAGAKAGARQRLTDLRKVALLAAALRNPHLTTLFCLDPYVAPHVRALHPGVEAVFLPDGVALTAPGDPPQAIRARWGVEAGRKVALLFGTLDARKGIFRLLEALPLLSAAAQRRLCVVFAGPLIAPEKAAFLAGVAALQATSALQALVEDRFFQDAAIQALVRSADLVLLTYQGHVGSSNVLVRAAAEGVPVLGPTEGLLGQHLRHHRLGVAVDTTTPEAIAAALERYLADPRSLGFDAAAARAFAAENTAERFAGTLFRHLGVSTQRTVSS